MNNTTNERTKPPFRSEAAFRRSYLKYLDMCMGDGDAKAVRRIPNTAGFCAFSSITSAQFAALRELYPKAFDIMRSHFIDAAVNSKLPNTGPVLEYLLGNVNRFCDDDGDYEISIDGGFDEDSI